MFIVLPYKQIVGHRMRRLAQYGEDRYSYAEVFAMTSDEYLDAIARASEQQQHQQRKDVRSWKKILSVR